MLVRVREHNSNHTHSKGEYPNTVRGEIERNDTERSVGNSSKRANIVRRAKRTKHRRAVSTVRARALAKLANTKATN